MGIRFRKRIKIAPGIHLNFSKNQTSLNIGPKGFNVTIGNKDTHLNAGIPGTGISMREKISGKQTSDNNEDVSLSVLGQIFAIYLMCFLLLLINDDILRKVSLFGILITTIIIAIYYVIKYFKKQNSK